MCNVNMTCARLRACGAGLAAIYTPTGFGSEIAEGKDIRYFDGRPYVLCMPNWMLNFP